MNSDELLGLLRESKIFRGISDEHLRKIAAHGDILHFSKNDLLIEEGQVGNPLSVILEGQAEVFLPKKRKDDNKERPTGIILDRFSQGDCAGEYSLIDNKPASASVIATQPCKIFRLARDEFQKIITYSNELEKTIYKNMLRVLIHRCRQSDSELDICY